MLEDNQKEVLDKPEILRRESMVMPVKKGKGWIFKLVLVLIIMAVILYLFTHPEIIQNPINDFFGRFS